MHYTKNYVPLESDPEIFTELMRDLGVSSAFKFIDIWSLEDDMLGLIPRPILALILVLPPCPTYEQSARSSLSAAPSDQEVSWFRQTINNACGLYAILHAVCNRREIISKQVPSHEHFATC